MDEPGVIRFQSQLLLQRVGFSEILTTQLDFEVV